MDFINSIKNWPFMNEPLYRWALFIIALTFILTAWHRVLEYMD